MISEMYADPEMFTIVSQALAEAGIEVGIGETLLVNGELDDDKVIIVKPDEWYNTARMAAPPKAVDGIVIVDNGGDHHIYVIELKSSRFPDLNRNHIQEKFETILGRFFLNDFARIFDDASKPYALSALRLWLVCDPLRLRRKAVDHEDFLRLATASKAKMRTLMANYALGFKPLAFKGVRAQILPMLSPPLIEVDHYVDHLA